LSARQIQMSYRGRYMKKGDENIMNYGNKLDRVLFENRMSTKQKLINKWTKIGAIIGGIWGLISLVLWLLASGGPTSSANPPITFVILTLPASIPILISYYVIELPGTVIVCSIPIFGIVIGALIGHAYEKWRKSK